MSLSLFLSFCPVLMFAIWPQLPDYKLRVRSVACCGGGTDLRLSLTSLLRTDATSTYRSPMSARKSRCGLLALCECSPNGNACFGLGVNGHAPCGFLRA